MDTHIDVSQNANWTERFAGLSRQDPAIKVALLRRSQILHFKKGATLFGADHSPRQMLFLVDGSVKVRQISESGNEIILYRIEAGQSCVLTTACLIAYDNYAAEGIAETKVTAAAVSADAFDELVASSKPFRDFVFSAFSKRITDMFSMIDAVAFQRLDARLAKALKAKAHDHHLVSITHQELATELGTAREVVSRALREFQNHGWIEQKRGAIIIRDAQALEAVGKS